MGQSLGVFLRRVLGVFVVLWCLKGLRGFCLTPRRGFCLIPSNSQFKAPGL